MLTRTLSQIGKSVFGAFTITSMTATSASNGAARVQTSRAAL